MWEDQNLAVLDWSRAKLKTFYYIMNNLFRITLNPKDNATDLNGYITNVFNLNPPQNSDNHKVIDYSMSWKKTGEAREIDPYSSDRSNDIDYRF